MSVVTLRNGRQVGDYLKPYIVAELNTSHFGDIKLARDMIDQAKDAGCDCVKFQSWSSETLYCDSYYKENAIAERIVKKFSLDQGQLKELSIYAREKDIDFSSTPYSLQEAEFLVSECKVPFVKIASMELNNLPYLQRLGELGAPLVLSTGMGILEEIVEAVNTIQKTGNSQIIILHCTSIYPATPEVIRLQNIAGLRSEFPSYPIGYSDHSLGVEIPTASIALGACIVEKHFTLDSSRIGMDNQMAIEPAEMQKMIRACQNVYKSMGGSGRVLFGEEIEQIPKMRRSMVAKIDIASGDILTADSVEFKRPGTGISPSKSQRFIGRKIINDLVSGTVIQEYDFD